MFREARVVSDTVHDAHTHKQKSNVRKFFDFFFFFFTPTAHPEQKNKKNKSHVEAFYASGSFPCEDADCRQCNSTLQIFICIFFFFSQPVACGCQLLLRDNMSAVVQPSWRHCTEGSIRTCTAPSPLNATVTVSTLNTLRPLKCLNNFSVTA